MAHTPGPWIIETGDYTGENWLVGTLFVGHDQEADTEVFVHITTDHIHASQLGYTTAMDDARLIAAAPDLLEALEWCANHLSQIAERDYPGIDRKARTFNSERAARAAIAKAKGGNDG